MRVKVDGLADAVQLELQNYSEEVKEGMTKAFKEIAAQCVKKLRQTSPKRGGDYAKSWKRNGKPEQRRHGLPEKPTL